MARKTSQELPPVQHERPVLGQYDIYPAFPIGAGNIGSGFEALAEQLGDHNRVMLDGYGGVFWEDLRQQLDAALKARGVPVAWHDVRTAHLTEREIEALVQPYVGGDDPIFGTRFSGALADFFDAEALAAIKPEDDAALSVVYGPGAALTGWDDAFLVYVDVPKNEIQFRSRAGSVVNLGCARADEPKKMYKRFYFVDWVALNRHKAQLLSSIDLIVDGQRPGTPLFMSGDVLREALSEMSQNYFRVRPWFEPGAWGGQWIKEHIVQLPRDVPNYAWSFELIVPENGLMVESDRALLEFSFDFLMYHDHRAVLGHAAEQFGFEFPIRFDFLDTFEGGNLSLQCHPRPEFITRHFGETFTQDETYYILDCKPDAQVYLGFQEGVSPQAFREALERSEADGVPVDVQRFVQVFPARKHDLFVIPNGTIHCSGRNNLVLEISATPYIFTFKMYDWLRLDLDGRPRPLNIARAFENLHFEYAGEPIENEFIPKPVLLERCEDWQLFHLPTHSQHFYDIHRLHIAPGKSVTVETGSSCHVLSLVEGETVDLATERGTESQFSYAETFVVPAAASSYRLANNTGRTIKVVKAFVKPAGEAAAYAEDGQEGS